MKNSNGSVPRGSRTFQLMSLMPDVPADVDPKDILVLLGLHDAAGAAAGRRVSEANELYSFLNVNIFCKT